MRATIMLPAFNVRRGRAIGVALTAALSCFLDTACGKKEAVVAPPPPEVIVSEVVQRDVPIVMELVGQTKGSEDVDIRARVEGFLTGSLSARGHWSRRDRSSTSSIRNPCGRRWRIQRRNWRPGKRGW